MSEDVSPEAEVPVQAPERDNPDQARVVQPVRNNNITRFPKNDSRHNTSTRYFEGATPKIGGVFGLCSKNVTKKITFDVFCEKISIYIMPEFNNGENDIEVLQHPDTKIVKDFQNNNKPKELTEEEKNL